MEGKSGFQTRLASLLSRRSFHLILLVIIPVGLYFRELNRYFVSEDFGLLRWLSEGSWLQTVFSQFYSSSFGLTYIQFYRPIGNLVVGIEYLLFGVAPFGYSMTHLAVHVLNTLLLYGCVKRMIPSESKGMPWCAALLFAIYPLQPNTVLKMSSYATLVHGTFFLLSLYFFLEGRQREHRKHYLLSLAAFVLALGSYELAFILPFLLLTYDVIVPRPARVQRSGMGWLKVYAPYAALLAGYLMIRKSIFGVFLGGYQEVGQRMVSWPPHFLSDFLNSIYPLLYPSFEGGEWMPGTTVVTVVLVLLAGLGIFARLSSSERCFSSLWLVALIWIAASQAPYAFIEIAPANARYWYVTSMGLALGITAWIQMVSSLVRLKKGIALGIVTLVIGLAWVNLLMTNLERYRSAGNLTRRIQTAVLREAETMEPLERVFVTGYPAFVVSANGTPVAPVFAWGLSDAVRPPFIEKDISLYPLPVFDKSLQVFPLARSDPLRKILVWDPSTESMLPFRLAPNLEKVGEGLKEIAVLAPVMGARLPRDVSKWRISFQPERHAAVTLFVTAPGFAWKQSIIPSKALASERGITLDLPLKLEVAAYYPGEIYWWLIAEDEGKNVTACSPLRSFTIH